MVYSLLSNWIATHPITESPRRIVLIRPCCIGDVVMATGALSALRETYPEAHITWAIGSWSARAIAHHPAIDAILDTGTSDLPVRSFGGMMRFVRQLRAGHFDMAVSLVRSPLMSLAVYLAGIPNRVGLDSMGRGFGYTVRVPIHPDTADHEGDIYLKVIQAIGDPICHAYANLPIMPATHARIQAKLSAQQVTSPFIVAHPGGGSNPGMQMDSKRYPLIQLADLLDRVAQHLSAQVILIGGEQDREFIQIVDQHMQTQPLLWVNELSFEEIGALANLARLYIGNDTGLTHIAAASGAKTVMMMGPTDPQRYAPFTADHLALWKPTTLQDGGVAQAHQQTWDWSRDGFTVDDALPKILAFLKQSIR